MECFPPFCPVGRGWAASVGQALQTCLGTRPRGGPMPAAYDQLSDDAIDAVLDAFYGKVRRDPALGPVFARAIADHKWPEHLRVIRDFWSSVMLKTGRYKGNPF